MKSSRVKKSKTLTYLITGLSYIYWISFSLQFATDNVFFLPNDTEDSRPAGGDVVKRECKSGFTEEQPVAPQRKAAQGSPTSRQKHEALLPTSKF